MTVQEVIDGFKGGEIYGAVVFVLPDGAEEHEIPLVEKVIETAFDPRLMVVAKGEPHVAARRSVRDAIVNGYSVMKGGSGRIAALINKSQEAVGDLAGEASGVGFYGMLAKLGIKALTNTPVTPLRKPAPYDEDALAEAVKGVCVTHKTVVYVRKAYRDAYDSLLFLYRTCGKQVDLMLGDDRHKLLVIFCIRAADLKKDLGRDIAEMAEGTEQLRVFPLDAATPAGPTQAETIADRIRRGTKAQREILEHVVALTGATDSKVFDARVIIASCKAKDDSSLTFWRRQQVLEPMTADGGDPLWTVSDAYDAWDLRNALLDVSGDDADGEVDGYLPRDEERADALFEAVRSVLGDTADTTEVLFKLARSGSNKLPAVALAERAIAQKASSSDLLGLDQTVREMWSFFESDIFPYGSEIEATDAQIGEVAESIRGLKDTLETLEREAAWGPVRGTLGRILERLATQFWSAIPEGLDEEALTIGRANSGYLQVLTRTGRVKLVALSANGLEARLRSSSMSPREVVKNPSRDGSISELQAVRLGSLAWLFGTNGEAICLPVSAIDAIAEDETGGVTENMSVYLDLTAKWTPTAPHFSASCPFSESEPPEHVLLVNEVGQATLIPLASLPRERGKRTRPSTSILTGEKPARWAVPVVAGDDLFVATTGNQILRLHVRALLDRDRADEDTLVALGDGEQVAAVTALPSKSELTDAIFVATEHGYGKLVSCREFPYGDMGGRGVVGQKVGKRSGSLCTIEPVSDSAHFILATASGGVARLPRSEIAFRPRTGVGLKLLPLDDGDRVTCACAY